MEIPDELCGSPTHLLHRAEQCAVDMFSAEMGDRDVTPSQLIVLEIAAQHDGLSQTDLVKHTGIDRSTMGTIVRLMQRKGLLERRRNRQDARAYAVQLTDDGRRLLRSAQPLAKRVDERILSALPRGQREKFIEELMSIVEELEKLRS